MLKRIYLNRNWLFSTEGNNLIVDIPHTVKELPFNYLNEEDYQFISTYTKTIKLENELRDKHLFLRFDGVGHKAEIYVNGTLLLTNNCGYNQFGVDIKDYVSFEKENEIKVVVDSRESLNIPPFGNVIDYLTYGGIYRDVYLDVCNDAYVEDVFIKPIIKDDKWYADIDVSLSEIKDYRLIINFGDEEIYNEIQNPSNTFETKTISFVNPKLWDIDNPNLYDLKIEVINKNELLDVYETHFGLRTCVFKQDGFYLNNKKVKILGLNRHQSYPYVGYAMPKSMQELDARILKEELCVNAVRTSHYMQSKYFLDMCDKLGLLVFTETPGWQYVGDDEWQSQAINNVKDMVLQNRNHPSIILWGARINESRDFHDFYSKTNSLIRSLDPTRQTGGVRCYTFGEELEDVYTYNDFLNPNEKRGLSRKKDIESGNLPYLVSEFNGHMHPSKMYDTEYVRVSHVLRLCKGMNEFYNDDEITGFFTWCMFDYNTHKDFGSGDRICYHGVLDMFRNPKIASYLYSSQGKKDYFMLSSHLNVGDYNGGTLEGVYAFTNADEIKLYRNGEFVRSFDHSNSPYSNIPNSPIYINDFVGNLLEVHEGYSKKASDMMKEVLYATLKYGNKMPLKYKLKYLRLMLFNKITFEKGYELYGKYIGNWGSKVTQYSFEALKNGKVFKVINLSKVKSNHIEVNPSSLELIEENTYDVSLVRIKALDQENNILPYYNEAINLKVEGNIEIIGPSIITFKGGYAGVFVKSKGKGSGKLIIDTLIGKEELTFNIK